MLWRVSEHDEPPEDLFVCPADELLPLRSYLLGILIFEVGSLIIDLRTRTKYLAVLSSPGAPSRALAALAPLQDALSSFLYLRARE